MYVWLDNLGKNPGFEFYRIDESKEIQKILFENKKRDVFFDTNAVRFLFIFSVHCISTN